eukprot:CAMPEP_0181311248 /NCGR_PEP_ID=MMETSP1101-20121128/13032_1 /TAXON_ID=46948 /ORGANISM="Rhodomonas abbreviata, Strain Caron Lab Isolate" /LENGTH=385 /DNA_ID=CAMNT_0023417959 /DNA_START=1 /DNA_END=1158 /DNA_ORIENTATION=-
MASMRVAALARHCRTAPQLIASARNCVAQHPSAAHRSDCGSVVQKQRFREAPLAQLNAPPLAVGGLLSRPRMELGFGSTTFFKSFSTDGESKEGAEVSVEASEESIEVDLSEVPVEDAEQLEALVGGAKAGSGKKKYNRPSIEEIKRWRIPLPDHKTLSPEAREMMAQLHREDPKKYNYEALGDKYGICAIRAQAIVMLEEDYENRKKSDMSENERKTFELAAEVEKKWYAHIGTVAHGSYTSSYNAEREGYRGAQADAQERGFRARPRPLYMVVDPSKAIKIIKRLEAKHDPSLHVNPVELERERLMRAAEAKVPVLPQIESKSGSKPTMSKRWTYVYADISRGVTGEQRMVACRAPDGSFRPGTLDERLRIERFVAPPRLPPK